MTIDDILREERAAIVDDAFKAVGKLTHYQLAGETETRTRIERLLEKVAEAITKRDLTELLAHTTRIAEERFAAGFQLSEVQAAFFSLEESIWRRALERLPPSQVAEALGLVGTALGRGKDALGRAYVSLATKTHAPSLDLTLLFKGTQGT